MKKLLIASATALAVAFAGMTPALAASTSPTAPYQVAQAKSDPAPTKKGKKKATKKSAEKKAEGGEKKAKKAKGKKKAA